MIYSKGCDPACRGGNAAESRWLRFARRQLRHLFPYLPGQPGYNKRLRKLAGTMCWLIRMLAADTSLWSDDVWVVDSTPVECGRSKETTRRSDLAGCAEYGYCASHSRYFWGLRLHLLCTLHGLPVGFAPTGAKADERQVLLNILDDQALLAGRAGQTIIGDQNYFGHDFEATLAEGGSLLAPPGPQGRPRPARSPVLQAAAADHRIDQRHLQGPTRLERHGGHTPAGVVARVLQRILALTAVIWHNDRTGQPVKRSLLAYDH
jgi:hypothetical protein